MDTVILQSFRQHAVPDWITRCMRSVQDWAEAQGYRYEFVDDSLFEYVPRNLREKPRRSILPLTDLARLGLLRDRLLRFERAVWMDADVLVFRPHLLRLPLQAGAMLCHEIWAGLDRQGALTLDRRINNAVMIFERDHPLPGFLHYAATELYSQLDTTVMPPAALGTGFLSRLGQLLPLRVFHQVACLSPVLLDALVHHRHPERLAAHAEHYGFPFHAANLCRSLHDDALDDTHMCHVVDLLLDNHGALVSPLPTLTAP